MTLNDKVILITGGTGSFGKKFTQTALTKYKPKKIIIFSRDEFKQFQMANIFSPEEHPIRYFLGDIRDKERLYRAFDGVDYVVHSAAMKQVPASEYNPFEAVKTNIIGAQNILEAALDKGVKKVIALSTDKAVSPVNLYGATKLSMEKLMVAANSYIGAQDTSFACVRYGNVVGSRGSVIPFFLKLIKEGVTELPITDDRMTRFWIMLEDGVDLVLTALKEAVGGEIFIPKIPSMKITDMARAMLPDCKLKIIGIRPGEKVHESLISEDEGRDTISFENNGKSAYIILPQYAFKDECRTRYEGIERLGEGFSYRSDTNDHWVGVDELKELIKDVLPE